MIPALTTAPHAMYGGCTRHCPIKEPVLTNQLNP
jgi:hypothetical protein